MNAMTAAAIVLFLLAAVVGLAAMGGGGMPGWNGWMPHMDWTRGMPHMGWGRSAGGAAEAPVPGAPELKVEIVDFGFRPGELRVRSGQRVNLQITNEGRVLHDFTVPAIGYQAVVQPGQQITVGLPALTSAAYEFYCSIPGHREAGMVGRLVAER